MTNQYFLFTTLVHASITGEGPQFTRTADEVEGQAEHCNKKKKASKIVQVGSPDQIGIH